MKLKFTKEEMALLNAICDIEVNAEGVKTYSMKPMVIDDEGCTCVEMVDMFKLASENEFLSDPSIDFKFKEPATKIIDEKEAQSIDNSVELDTSRERKKHDALFDSLYFAGVRLFSKLHHNGEEYVVSDIDMGKKKYFVVDSERNQYDYFELLKSNQ